MFPRARLLFMLVALEFRCSQLRVAVGSGEARGVEGGFHAIDRAVGLGLLRVEPRRLGSDIRCLGVELGQFGLDASPGRRGVVQHVAEQGGSVDRRKDLAPRGLDIRLHPLDRRLGGSVRLLRGTRRLSGRLQLLPTPLSRPTLGGELDL